MEKELLADALIKDFWTILEDQRISSCVGILEKRFLSIYVVLVDLSLNTTFRLALT
jgi:hypothetical protein